jgi:ribonuclease HII
MAELLTGGLDEVGWGSLAGPIVSVVAVMTKKDLLLLPKGVTDSKKLSPLRRESFFLQLCAAVTDVGLGAVEPWEIDKMGPKFALQESYNRALAELHHAPDLLIVDGSEWTNRVKGWAGKQEVVPKADFKFKEVSIASIIAKVVRDRVMVERAARLKKLGFPDYNWAENKGYGTPDHFAAIQNHGLLFGPEHDGYQHRKSYCKNLMGKVKIYKKET